MTVTAHAIVEAAVEAAKEELRKQGLESDIPMLPRLFSKVLGDAHAITSAIVITKNGNNPAMVSAVKKILETKLKHSIDVIERADPSILGGAILQFGDERIDLSVKGTLERFSQSLGTHA